MAQMVLEVDPGSFTNDDARMAWTWALTVGDGSPIRKPVSLNKRDPRFEDLAALGLLRSLARDNQEHRLGEIASWVAEEVFGGDISAALDRNNVAGWVVKVKVPPDARELFLLPLELAFIRRRLTLVHEDAEPNKL